MVGIRRGVVGLESPVVPGEVVGVRGVRVVGPVVLEVGVANDIYMFEPSGLLGFECFAFYRLLAPHASTRADTQFFYLKESIQH